MRTAANSSPRPRGPRPSGRAARSARGRGRSGRYLSSFGTRRARRFGVDARCSAGSGRSSAPPRAPARWTACRARAAAGAEEAAHAEPVDPASSTARAVVAVAEVDEGLEVAAVGRRVCGDWSRSFSRWVQEFGRLGPAAAAHRTGSLPTDTVPKLAEHALRHRHRSARSASSSFFRVLLDLARQRIEQPEVRVHRLEVLRVRLAQVAVERAEHRRRRRDRPAPRRRACRERLMPASSPVAELSV